MRGRVRWGNVGRAAGAVAVAGLVVAWPRLDGGQGEVPSGRAVPVVRGGGTEGGGGERVDGSRDAPAVQEPGRRARRQGRAVTHAQLRAPSRRPARSRPSRARAGGSAPRVAARSRPVAPAATAAPAPSVAPPAPTVPVAPAPVPPRVAPSAQAPALDPAEREFGFER